jgi:hypothetical protein
MLEMAIGWIIFVSLIFVILGVIFTACQLIYLYFR